MFPRTMRLSYIMLPYVIVSASAGALEENERKIYLFTTIGNQTM